MPLFDYPTASEITDDTGLRPEQVNTKYTSADLEADITQKIEEAATVVEGRILAATSPEPFPFSEDDLTLALPKYSIAARDERLQGQQLRARQATKWLAMSYLYDRSGQLSKAYEGKSEEYEANAERTLTGKDDGSGTEGLLGELRAMAAFITEGLPENGNPVALVSFIPAIEQQAPHYDEFGAPFEVFYG